MASLEDMYLAADVTSNVAWMAPKFSRLNMSAVVLLVNDWYNINGGDNASSEALANYLGTDIRYVDLTYEYFGNQSVAVGMVASAADVIPHLPHPKGNPAATPIFVILTVLCVLCLGLRFYSRVVVQGKFWLYDWIMLAGFTVAFGNALMDEIMLTRCPYIPYTTAQYCFTLHVWLTLLILDPSRVLWDYTWPAFQAKQAASLALEVLNPLAIVLVKTSLLVFYHTLTAWPPLRYATYTVEAIIIANGLVAIFVPIFQCTPVLYWVGTSWMSANCDHVSNKNFYRVLLITGGVNIATDVIIWLLPIPMIMKLPITMRERWLSMLTFGVGIVACVASGLKLYWQKFSVTTAVPYNYGSEITIWRTTEIYLAVICASIPAIRALVIKKMPTVLSGSKKALYTSSGDKSGGSNTPDRSNVSGSSRDRSPFPQKDESGAWVTSHEV